MGIVIRKKQATQPCAPSTSGNGAEQHVCPLDRHAHSHSVQDMHKHEWCAEGPLTRPVLGHGDSVRRPACVSGTQVCP